MAPVEGHAYNTDEMDPGMFSVEIAQLLNLDTEDEEFNGYVDN